MIVTLNEDEFDLCVQVGLRRQHSAIAKRLKDSVKSKRDWVDALGGHVKGAIGEMAVAKALGLSWTGSVDVFKSASDVGHLEVRHRSNPVWDLIVRDDDNSDSVFVLSRGLPPGAIEVCGWIKGADAKNARWRQQYGGLRPAYFVPAEELQPLETLHANS